MDGLPAVYEELDLTANDRTSRLPFVNGRVASFRHYAGTPLVAPSGMVIDTVFTFSNQRSEGLQQRQRQFLTNTSDNVMRQLMQAVRALEGSRAVMFNTAVASLLSAAASFIYAFDKDPHSANLDSKRNNGEHAPFVLNIYEHASELLLSAFELDGAQFLNVALASHSSPFNREDNFLLAESHRIDHERIATTQNFGVSNLAVRHLILHHPHGAVFHLSGNEVFITASGKVSAAVEPFVNAYLRECFPEAQQVLFSPLWDSTANNHCAVAFGWMNSFDRVFASNTDLSQLSAFCTTVMAQIRRMEGHVTDVRKADFLGSISHELRSPLHGALASLELLEGTECSHEQMELIESARAGGIELLDTIDQILTYTKINPTARIMDDDSSGDCQSLTPDSGTRDSDSETSNEVELLSHCEAIVAKVVQKTRTQDLMNPPTGEDAKPVKTHPVVITLDAVPGESKMQLKNHEAYGIVLENLLANSLKYSGIDCCLRAGISIDDENVTTTITDCGKGISKGFLRNSLFVPFSQASPIDAGAGLGLPLVKRTVEALNGTMRIESDESLGTLAEAIVPLAMLKGKSEAGHTQAGVPIGLRHVPSPLKAQLFVPPAWKSGVYGGKGDRLVNNLLSSLTRNLNGLVPTELKVWESQCPHPDVIFLRHGDIAEFLTSCGHRYSGIRKVIVGGKAKPEDAPVHTNEALSASPGPVVEVAGPLIPSKVAEALAKVFATPLAPEGLADRTAALAIDDGEALKKESPPTQPESSSKEYPTGMDEQKTNGHASEKQPKEPRLLLVDDNAVNLKLLGKFVLKAGIKTSTSASGGQEAIDAYEKALNEGNPFSICFMDLSMPDVDGFQATAEIRQGEAKLAGQQRINIVALTGLVSGKDRSAAMAAGADGYITKPAKIKDVQEVIENWRASQDTAKGS